MTDVPHHTPVSGLPEGSRAARRLEARPHGGSEWLAPRLRRLPSLLVSWIVANAMVLFLAAAMIGLGFLVTKVLLKNETNANADNWLPEWFAAHRTPFWNDWSEVGSKSADVPVIVPLIAAVALFLVVRRRWRMASFTVQTALCETLCYSIVVLSSAASGRRSCGSTRSTSTTVSRPATRPSRSRSTAGSHCYSPPISSHGRSGLRSGRSRCCSHSTWRSRECTGASTIRSTSPAEH
jgi:hypothetical protein